jgi:hypothetical protein
MGDRPAGKSWTMGRTWDKLGRTLQRHWQKVGHRTGDAIAGFMQDR